MENKIWDILENVRQGYITVNDGTQQVLDLFAVPSIPDPRPPDPKLLALFTNER